MGFVSRHFYDDDDYDDDDNDNDNYDDGDNNDNNNSIFYLLMCQFNSPGPTIKLAQSVKINRINVQNTFTGIGPTLGAAKNIQNEEYLIFKTHR